MTNAFVENDLRVEILAHHVFDVLSALLREVGHLRQRHKV